jgi:hypothetical protein
MGPEVKWEGCPFYGSLIFWDNIICADKGHEIVGTANASGKTFRKNTNP